MPAVPGRLSLTYEVQDNRGFRANVRLNGFETDYSAAAAGFQQFYQLAVDVGTVLQTMTNAKVVKTGLSAEWSLAQEPSSESGTYELVQQKARLNFADGQTNREILDIPAPKDNLFLTVGQDNLLVIDPTAAALAALQAAVLSTAGPPARVGLFSPSGGHWGAQFFGGQLIQGKPRRRRVIQGS